jgi:hypothetical protein
LVEDYLHKDFDLEGLVSELVQGKKNKLPELKLE